MKIFRNETYLSATDLSTYIACKHATYLNLLEAKGEIKAPYFDDPALKALQEKGEEFEQNYVEELKVNGKTVIEINKEDRRKAVSDTMQAMKDGYDVICQARLEHGIWNGWADFLIKVPKESNLGNWSYEVLDTKLSKHTKAGAILQISLYSEMLENLQDVKPEHMHIKNPEGEIA
jgi:predicted RecB family nuclease